MDLEQSKMLWFTTTMSVNMEGRNGAAAFNGLYECALDQQTGKCAAPEKIVDVFNPPNEHHRGLDMMNVRIDNANSTMYSGYYDGHRNSFEILKGRLDTPPVVLESYFRSDAVASNAECLMQCCGKDLEHHTYYQVEPRDYTLHDGEVFVSWDGFYQNCADEFAAKFGLRWTIGVSKIKQSPECVNNGGDHAVRFEDCTVPVAILFQERLTKARGKILGYSGFQAAYSPSRTRIFFLAAIDNDEIEQHDGKLFSEVWAMAEGGNHAKTPSALQVFGSLPIAHTFASTPVDDVATIRLRENEDGEPTGLCRTAYDAGVACYSFTVEEEDELRIAVSRESMFVTSDQVKESCTIPVNEHYAVTKHLPAVTTGLEVVWDPYTTAESPKMLFFGCYGEIPNHGNLTTAFKDGRLVQTLPGAYSGSILFGPDEAVKEIKPADFPPQETPSKSSFSVSTSSLVVLLLGLLVGLFIKRKTNSRLRVARQYDLVLQREDDEIEFGAMSSSTTAYVEMSTPQHEAEAEIVTV